MPWARLATLLSPYVLPFGALAEIVLMLWLLVKGVNVAACQESADAGPFGAAR